jgi:hypothetical protein
MLRNPGALPERFNEAASRTGKVSDKRQCRTGGEVPAAVLQKNATIVNAASITAPVRIILLLPCESKRVQISILKRNRHVPP